MKSSVLGIIRKITFKRTQSHSLIALSIILFVFEMDCVSIPWWQSHPIHKNRATESIWTEPCNPMLRATKSTKRATSD